LAVYGPALEKSLNDKNTEIYWSTPIKDAPLMEVAGKMWPTNYDGGYSGNSVSLQHALAESMNTVSARVVDMIGPSYGYDFMINRFHISTLDVFDERHYGAALLVGVDKYARHGEHTCHFCRTKPPFARDKLETALYPAHRKRLDYAVLRDAFCKVGQLLGGEKLARLRGICAYVRYGDVEYLADLPDCQTPLLRSFCAVIIAYLAVVVIFCKNFCQCFW
jgi:hypothetical protein